MRLLGSIIVALLAMARPAMAAECTGQPNGTLCTDDRNPCTDDYCFASVCTHPAKPNGLACTTDSNDCTSDTCFGGVCAHWPICTDDCACAVGPVRLVTSCTDPTPNTSAIIPTDARVWQQKPWSPLWSDHRQNAADFSWWFTHADPAQTISVTWWAYDATAARWAVADTAAGVAVGVTQSPVTDLGPLNLYPQVTACSALIGAGITIYANSR